MSSFVLVHGSWHGAWCWDKMVPRLEAAGHQAIAIDLPGHGADSTPLEGMTLASYADRVCETLAALPEPAILVGHSMAGVVISQAAEQCPERIRTLVYLAAYLPRDGESLLQLALTDAGSQITPALVLDEAHGYHYLREDARPAALYHDCSPADVARAQSLLVVESNAVVGTPVHLTTARYGRVPRVYIRTTQDRGVTPELQDRMIAAAPCAQVFTLATSHSPFLSDPDSLLAQLTAIAAMPVAVPA